MQFYLHFIWLHLTKKTSFLFLCHIDSKSQASLLPIVVELLRFAEMLTLRMAPM